MCVACASVGGPQRPLLAMLRHAITTSGGLPASSPKGVDMGVTEKLAAFVVEENLEASAEESGCGRTAHV